jgi:hypothetical protein
MVGNALILMQNKAIAVKGDELPPGILFLWFILLHG